MVLEGIGSAGRGFGLPWLSVSTDKMSCPVVNESRITSTHTVRTNQAGCHEHLCYSLPMFLQTVVTTDSQDPRVLPKQFLLGDHSFICLFRSPYKKL